MEMPLYTIGHGNRPIDTFIDILKRYQIAFVIDVRSQPYSRYTPQFSQTTLERSLTQWQMRYLFMGDTLGGRPLDASCYIDGKVDYGRVSEKAFYQQGINRLRSAWEKQLSVALLCSEAKPQECHRSKLIGNTLFERQIPIVHIDEEGELKTQEEINLMLSNGQLSLFEEHSLVSAGGKVGRSRKKIHPRSDQGVAGEQEH